MAVRTGLNTADIKSQANQELLALLQGVRGKKNIVLQKSLVGVINLLVRFSTLQSYGVERIFWLDDDNVDSSQRSVVFLASGEKPANAQLVAQQVKRLQANQGVDHDFHVFWIPRRALVADQILEAEGVLGEVSVKEFPLYFVALDTDLLSLELSDSYGKLYLDRDVSPIYTAAKGLMALQTRYGLFPRITGKGDNARRLADLLIRMRAEKAISEGSRASSLETLIPSDVIDNLIIIDREADPLTPLLTQLTYEGLLDELYGVQNSQLEVDSTILGSAPEAAADGNESIPQASRSRKRKIPLDSTDALYAGLRSKNFSAVGSVLNRTARRLEADFASRHTTKSTAELKDFVQRLPKLQAEQQSLKIHTNLAEDMSKKTETDLFTKSLEVQQNLIAGADLSSQSDAIHDLICRALPLSQSLRLLCIASLTASGLRPRDFDALKQAVLHAYGFQHLLTLNALTSMGLFTARASTASYLNPLAQSSFSSSSAGSSNPAVPDQTSYATLRNPLKLVDDDVSESEPTGISYTYSGYAPLSIRILQCALDKPSALALSKPAPSSATTAQTLSGDAPAPPAQGWRPFEDLLRSVRGATFSELQRADDQVSKTRAALIGGAAGTGGGTGAGTGAGAQGEKTSVVMFLGGVTQAEIAAVRFLGERLKGRRRIVVATTQILRGDEVVGCAVRRAEG